MTSIYETMTREEVYAELRSRRIAFLLSGDPEQDADTARQILRRDDEARQNRCPNGCGPMQRVHDHLGMCPVCSFTHFSSTPVYKLPAQ